jgi:branched-chain amino acid transport system ATP-binding protein
VTGTPRDTAGTAGPSAESDAGLLSLRGLTAERSGRTVLHDVSIEIPAGQVTALLGPNGAGKSTLVLAVGGVLGLRCGSVLLDGRELARHRPERIRRAGLAIVPEGRRLLAGLTVEDNLRVATYALSGGQARAGRERALELFPEIGRRLSARARVSQPRYILIDELSLGLAPVVVGRLIPTIRAIADSGIGVLLIEQFATLALGLARRAYVLEGGRLRFSGPASELREKPELLRSAYLLRGSSGAAG